MKTSGQITEFSNEMADRLGLPRYYKVLRSSGLSTHAYTQWSLPRGNEPGEWMRVKGRLVECRNGIHACRLGDIMSWLSNPTRVLYEIELDEDAMIHRSNKVCSRAGRLVRRIEFDMDWVRGRRDAFVRPEARWSLHTSEASAGAAAAHMLVGDRQRNVDGMIEQLVAEQLAA